MLSVVVTSPKSMNMTHHIIHTYSKTTVRGTSESFGSSTQSKSPFERVKSTPTSLPSDAQNLPEFADRIARKLQQQCDVLHRRNKEPFLLDLKIQLDNVSDRLKAPDQIKLKRVQQLLLWFEQVLMWPDRIRSLPSTTVIATTATSYPSCNTFLRSEAQAAAARQKLDRLAKERVPRAVDFRTKLSNTLRNFASAESGQLCPDRDELTKDVSRGGPLALVKKTHLDTLYEKFCEFCRCSALDEESSFDVNLALTTIATNNEEDIHVNLFLRHKHSDIGDWRETTVRVFHHSGNVVQFEQSGNPVQDLCALVRRETASKLKLAASQAGLYNEGDGLRDPNKNVSLFHPCVPLADVLASKALKTDDKTRKVLLSFLVAKAVWQFYDSAWMSKDWTKHTIRFMQQEEGILQHEPFVAAGFKALTTSRRLAQHATISEEGHYYPKILALGIMLLEIELGEPIENRYTSRQLNRDHQPVPGAAWDAAGLIIQPDNLEWQRRVHKHRTTYKIIAEIIETCIKPDLGKLGEDPSQVKDRLFQTVVSPLHSMLELMHGDPEKLNLGSLHLPSAVTRDTAGHRFTPCVQREAPEHCVGNSVSRSSVTLLTPNNTVNDSSDWLLKFEESIKKLRSKQVRDLERPIRVAVLDTGCNLKDEFFQERGIENIEELPGNGCYDQGHWFDCLGLSNEARDDDENQHGTAIVALLLRLVIRPILHIVRVRKSSDDTDSMVDAVVRGIQYAADEKVDIVSMSFGFNMEHQAIVDAIDEARRKCQNKILFFAAANNDGKNDPEMFPAHYSPVISVRGTTHTGSYASQYNPDLMWPKDIRFGTLSKDVPCYGTNSERTKSGCSIATPILVAITSAIMAFVVQGDFEKALQERIMTKEGMSQVFQDMACKQENAPEKLYLAPWLLSDRPEPQTLIRNAYQQLPPKA